MFNDYGQPTGYDQIAPGRDLPKQTDPLNRAIMGQAPPNNTPTPPSQYQPDDTLMAWRSRQPGPQTNIGQQPTYSAPTAGAQRMTPGAGAPPSQGGLGSGSDPASYTLSLIQGGMDPAQAAQQTNSRFNLQTGSQAVYYPENNTIGLPGVYLAGPTNRPDSPSAWGITQRVPERPHAMAPMTAPLMSAIGGAANGQTPIYQTLLQQLLQTQAQQQAQLQSAPHVISNGLQPR